MSRVYVLVFACFCACLSMAFTDPMPDLNFPPKCVNASAVNDTANAVKVKVPKLVAGHMAACNSRCNVRRCHNRLAEVNHDKGCLNVSNLILKNLDLRNFNQICVIGYNLTVNNTLRLGDGLNCVFLNQSNINNLEGGPQEDDVFANGSAVHTTNLRDGNDVFSLNFSYALDIHLGKGNDSLYLGNVYVRDVDGSDGDDDIYLNAGYVHDILGGKGDDTAFLRNFSVQATNLGYGRDVLVLRDGTNALVNDPDEGLVVYEAATTNYNADNVTFRTSPEFTCKVKAGSF